MSLFIKDVFSNKNNTLKENSSILCLIAKDQKEFLRAKRLISKVRINSWSFVGSLVLSSLALECPTIALCLLYLRINDDPIKLK